jgi:hypothetical protein
VRRTSEGEGSESDSFEPEYHQIKKLGLKVNKKRFSTGGWSARENQVYLQFMVENAQDFLTEKSRRKTKVFFRLSKILRKRTPDQCRSHHQKLQLKYRDDLYAIISEVDRKIKKGFAEEYVNEQHRLQQTQHLLALKPLPRTAPEDQHPVALMTPWRRVWPNGFRVEVDSSQVASW